MNKRYNVGLHFLGLIFLFAGILVKPAWGDYISLPANTVIGVNDTTYDNASISINAVTVTINGQHTFADVEIKSGGKITAAVGNKLILTVNALTIDSTSTIDVSGKGYASGYTLGNTTSGGSVYYAGGSYGGKGGLHADYRSATNNAYGDYRNPAEFGSGGGGGNLGAGGTGGGLVRIVANSIILNGNATIKADGNANIGGGSGGGIRIDAETLSGTGSISATGANGGWTGQGSYGGGGSGGQIAVYYTDKSGFTGSVLAYGGTGLNNGGAGTIYLKSATQQNGDLIVDNNNRTTSDYSTTLRSIGTNTSDSITYDPASGQSALTKAGANWPIPNTTTGALGLKSLLLKPNTSQNQTFEVINNTATTIIVNGDMTQVAAAGNTYVGTYTFDNLTVRNQAKLSTGDNIYVLNTNQISNGVFKANALKITDSNQLQAVNATLDVSKPLFEGHNTVVLDGDTLIVNNISGVPSLQINNNSTLTLSNITGAIQNLGLTNTSFLKVYSNTPLQLTAGTITVNTGCSIDASGKGYAPGYTLGNTGGSVYYAGGSYGGKGGLHADARSAANNAYGDYRNPAEFGSGGGNGNLGSGGTGGGLVRIAADSLILNGSATIKADGSGNLGGGSGGGIRIDVGTLSGTGSISAIGGNGSYDGSGSYTGGGGGGRIAVYYADKSGFTGNMLVYGGTGGKNGGAGTIYLKSSAQQYGDLIIDNNNRTTSDYSTLLRSIGANTSDNITYDPVGGQSTLTKAGANWPVPNTTTGALGLKGLMLNPNTGQNQTFEVINNTATTITVNGDMTQAAAAGNTYIGVYTFNSLYVINGAQVSAADDVHFDNLYTDNGKLNAHNIYQSGAAVIKPTLNTVTTPTVATTQTLSGTKENGTAIILNGAVVVPVDTQTTWSYAMPLVEGNNPINIYARNAQNMASGSVTSAIFRDTTPPYISASTPVNGANLNATVNLVDITLSYTGAAINLNSSIAGAVVQNGNGVTMPGQWAGNGGNRATFTPSASLGEGVYTATIHPTDTLGNIQAASITFTVDLTPPAPLTLNPPASPTKITPQTISGGKEADTSVWLDGAQIIANNTSTTWSYQLNLNEGVNSKQLSLKDKAGNISTNVNVSIILDRVPPVLQSSNPANGASLNQSPAQVSLVFTDSSTSLASAPTLASAGMKNSHMQVISGAWAMSAANTLTFTPASSLPEETYTARVTAEDTVGNAALAAVAFTCDYTPPVAPVINQLPIHTNFSVQTLSGVKEANSSIWLNGNQIVGINLATTWSYQIHLTEGNNTLEIYAVDAAGNRSASVNAAIDYDETAPLPVSNLSVDGNGSGSTATLNWNGYNEAIQGDVDHYLVYVSNQNFTQVTGLTPVANIPAGTFSYTATNLTKGNTYYFVVIAVDNKTNALTSATPVSAIPVDTIAPEPITNLTAQGFANSLVFNWNASANTQGDLAGYKVYFNNDATGIQLPTTQLTYEATGLNPASGYTCKVKAIDGDGNQSTEIAITGYTWLLNPANLTVTPYSGRVDLSWSQSTPANLVKYYSVCQSQTNFNSVNGMTPVMTTTGTSAKIARLSNGTTYYFAVTAVNIADGEQKNVAATAAEPVPDTQGPQITNVQLDSNSLNNGMTISKTANISLSADDPAGISRVEFKVDGSLYLTDSAAPYSCLWNVALLIDSQYTLDITAYDTLGNSTTNNYNLTVALASPDSVPTISQPATSTITNKTIIAISGTADSTSEVLIYKNGALSGAPLAVNSNGVYNGYVELSQGVNSLQAASQNRAGIGALSTAVAVTLDTNIPQSPTGVEAKAQEAGAIKLSWVAQVGIAVKGFNIYRATGIFNTKEQAAKINSALIANASYTDIPANDATYYYRITVVNTAENESDLSNLVSASSDRTPPKAVSIIYTSSGVFDADSGKFGTGTVEVLLTVSKPLISKPFLSITPHAGFPLFMNLTKVSDVSYSGYFEITADTATGTAYAVFSARDMVGNRGTGIDAGDTLEVDNDGPALTYISIEPKQPVKNDALAPVSLTVTFGLDEPVKSGAAPVISFLLSGQGRTETPIINLTPIDTLPDQGQTWQAVFALPNDAGLTQPENLQFIFSANDVINNHGSKITCANSFQVYQGELPPLTAPTGLVGQTLASGQIKLIWNIVPGAIGYKIYRQSPGEGAITEYATLDNVLQYTDQTSVDGTHIYAIASIRQENGQEAISALCEPIQVTADSTAPFAPRNLTLALTGSGIEAVWEAPIPAEPVTYSLYRTASVDITSVAGLTPIATGIQELEKTDAAPSPTDHVYAVTAKDAAGNESAPSNSYYLNFDLLPVASLNVQQQDKQMPVVSWTHNSPEIAGYDIYEESNNHSLRLNSALITDLFWIDSGYTADERRYTVIAIDNQAAQSPGRSVNLPRLAATLQSTSPVLRNVMNRLEYLVSNNSAQRVDNIRLKATLADIDHASAKFALEPAATKSVALVIGGYAALPDIASIQTALEVTPDSGETVKIVRNDTIEVGNGMLAVSLHNEEFVRATNGSVWFSLENTGAEEIEIITAKGVSASDEINISLLDADGNVISAVPFKQNTGTDVITIGGQTVARIAAGKTFASNPIEIPVPETAPDALKIKLSIDKVHYHSGKSDQVTIDGLSTTRNITLIDTSYYGEISSVTPQTSTGDQPIVITGRAVERSNSQPLAKAALKLIITLNGFERTFKVFTDSVGQFSYAFAPSANESGAYKVCALHPDLLDRPIQAEFVIERITAQPNVVNLTVARNYQQNIPITVTAGDATSVNNLRLVYQAQDQTGGVLPEGVFVTLAEPINLTSKGTAVINATVGADNRSPAECTLTLKLISDENIWATIIINMKAVDIVSQPVLYFAPNYIETGVGLADMVSETVTLTNKGNIDLKDVALALINTDSSPAPAWLRLNANANQGDIASNETRTINLAFNPPSGTAEGDYQYKLRVTSSNHATTDIDIFIAVTQSAQGSVIFKAADIYTATVDNNGQMIQGVSGADIRLQNELVATQEYRQYTDGVGEAIFADIPAGRYRYKITKANHTDQTGYLWIKPGVVLAQDVFLDMILVTVEWEVKETTIQDKYEITLRTTYETKVPAPVIVAEPTSVTLPDMQPGDVFNFEVTFTNHGLIRADNVRYTKMKDDRYFKFETMGTVPEHLGAYESFTLAYKVACLASRSSGSGAGASSDCIQMDDYPASVTGCYTCANGVVTYLESSIAAYSKVINLCGGSEGGSSPRQTILSQIIGSSATGINNGIVSGSKPQSGGTQIDGGKKCFPKPPTCEGPCCPPFNSNQDGKEPKTECEEKDEDKDTCTMVGSGVLLTGRQYTDSVTDLRVKVMGGYINIGRSYYDGEWQFKNTADRLEFHIDYREIASANCRGNCPLEMREELDYIVMQGRKFIRAGQNRYIVMEGGKFDVIDQYQYQYSDADYRTQISDIYVSEEDDQSIVLKQEGSQQNWYWLWQNKSGDWKKYQLASEYISEYGEDVEYGHLLAAGNKNLTVATYVYADQDSDLLTGIFDHAGTQRVWFEYDQYRRLTSVRDAQDPNTARQVRYIYNGLLARVTDVAGGNWFYTYNVDGLLTAKTDPANRANTINYNVNGRVTSVTDHAGNSTSFEYDYDQTKGQYYARITYPGGKIKELLYDKNGRRISTTVNGKTANTVGITGRNRKITDAAGNVTEKVYDERGNLIRQINPDGTSETWQYDLRFSLVVKHVDEKGTITAYVYDDNGNMIKLTEAAGTALERVTEYVYDVYGQRIKTVLKYSSSLEPQASNEDDIITSQSYDDNGNVTATTDALGHTVTYTYDNTGNMTAKTDERGKVWSYEYDAAGRLVSSTDPLGNVSHSEYDAVGNVVRTVDAAGHSTSFEYDHKNRLTKTTYADGSFSASTYNSDGQMIKQTDQEGKSVSYVYDIDGRLSQTIDGSGNTITNEYADAASSGCQSCSAPNQPSRIIYPTFAKELEYDTLGRTTKELDVLSDTEVYSTRYEYDSAGKVVSTIDKQGNTTGNVYDRLGRLTQVTDPQGGVTSYTYDARNNLITLTDAKGQTTRFEYDKLGRKVKEIRPMGQATTYVYTETGQLSYKVDAKNQKTAYVYDDAGRLTTTYYYNVSTNSLPVKTVNFNYNATGRLTGYDDGITSAVYEYDNINRNTSQRVNYGAFSLSSSYVYFANGRKKSITYPDGITYSYSYNNNKQLADVTIPGQGMITYNSYTWKKPNSITVPGGSKITYDYDQLMRIKAITAQDPAQTILMNYQYSYDRMNNITLKQTDAGNYAYLYDNLYQLKSADNPGVNDEIYNYDTAGNRLTDNTGETWSYNSNNQILNYAGNSFIYDNNGNMTQQIVDGVTRNFVYDIENRLIRIEEGSNVVAEYYYDPVGRRLWKEVGGVKTYFFYADEGLLGEYSDNGTEIRTYGWKPNSTWSTDPLFLQENGNYYFYQNDHLGTPVKLINPSGAVLWSVKYQAFGKIINTINNNYQPFRFSGQYYDIESELYYNWNRYYNADLGRYISIDPIGIIGSINLYKYSGDNPINFIDSTGLKSDCCNAKLPESPIKEVALTCFAEADDSCTEGDKEKQAITDCIYNRVEEHEKYKGRSWCTDGGIIGILSCKYNDKVQFLGYQNSKYKRAEDSKNLNETDCTKLKSCISAAQGSSSGTQTNFVGFNQSNVPGRVKICNHYFYY